MGDVTDQGDGQAGKRATLLTDRQNVQQPLRWMLVGTVAGIENGAIEPIGQHVRGAGRSVANDDRIDVHRFDVLGRVDERLPLGQATSRRRELDRIRSQTAGR